MESSSSSRALDDEDTPIILSKSSRPPSDKKKPVVLRTGRVMTETLYRSTRKFVPYLPPPRKFDRKVKDVVVTVLGVAGIFGTERFAFAVIKHFGLGIPSAPLGMLMIFLGMLLLQATSEDMTLRTLSFFGPGRNFYKLWVPLFFSAPLVDLPLALRVIPAAQVAKILLVITVGTMCTLLTTAIIVSPLLRSTETKPPPSNLPPTAASPQTTVTLTAAGFPLRLASISLAVSVAAFLAGLANLGVIALSVATLEVGKALPAKVKGVVPPIATGALLACIGLCLRGKLLGLGYVEALGSYRAVGGPGRLLLSQAAPAVVSLGFGLFEQRSLLKRKAVPIAGGAALTTLCSLVGTVALARLLGLPPAFSLGLAPRFITLPISMPMAESLGGATAVTAMSVVLEGVVGANVGFKLLNIFRVSDPVARGISIGSCSHALGTAAAFSDEPDSGPSSAVTFLLCGITGAALVNVPALRSLLFLVAGK